MRAPGRARTVRPCAAGEARRRLAAHEVGLAPARHRDRARPHAGRGRERRRRGARGGRGVNAGSGFVDERGCCRPVADGGGRGGRPRDLVVVGRAVGATTTAATSAAGGSSDAIEKPSACRSAFVLPASSGPPNARTLAGGAASASTSARSPITYTLRPLQAARRGRNAAHSAPDVVTSAGAAARPMRANSSTTVLRALRAVVREEEHARAPRSAAIAAAAPAIGPAPVCTTPSMSKTKHSMRRSHAACAARTRRGARPRRARARAGEPRPEAASVGAAAPRRARRPPRRRGDTRDDTVNTMWPHSRIMHRPAETAGNCSICGLASDKYRAAGCLRARGRSRSRAGSRPRTTSGARAYLGGGSKAWRFFALDAATGELVKGAPARAAAAATPTRRSPRPRPRRRARRADRPPAAAQVHDRVGRGPPRRVQGGRGARPPRGSRRWGRHGRAPRPVTWDGHLRRMEGDGARARPPPRAVAGGRRRGRRRRGAAGGGAVRLRRRGLAAARRPARAAAWTRFEALKENRYGRWQRRVFEVVGSTLRSGRPSKGAARIFGAACSSSRATRSRRRPWRAHVGGRRRRAARRAGRRGEAARARRSGARPPPTKDRLALASATARMAARNSSPSAGPSARRGDELAPADACDRLPSPGRARETAGPRVGARAMTRRARAPSLRVFVATNGGGRANASGGRARVAGRGRRADLAAPRLAAAHRPRLARAVSGNAACGLYGKRPVYRFSGSTSVRGVRGRGGARAWHLGLLCLACCCELVVVALMPAGRDLWAPKRRTPATASCAAAS